METETTSVARRSAARIDRLAFDHQLHLRGLSQRDLAKRAGLHEVIVSRARLGQPVTQKTLRKILGALLAAPVLEGADLILEKKDAEGAAPPASREVSASAAGRTTSTTS